jgi:secreted Zn-dependent insulinase-like peptidase
VVTALREFHETFYSSDIMALAVRTNMDLNEMEEYIVHQSGMSEVVNRNRNGAEEP